MGLSDEKDIVLLSIIMATFILIVISNTIGTIYAIMAISYAVAIALKNKAGVIEFSRKNTVEARAVFIGLAAVGIFIAIGAVVLGSQEAFTKAVTFFASSFLTNFTINDPFVKVFVFGFFIPVVESLFFFGVIYKFVLDKLRATGRITSGSVLFSFILIAGIAASFHFAVRLLNDQALTADLIFFGISGALVYRQKQLLEAALMHIAFNTVVVAGIVGWIPRII